jgi:hypothetical protein
VPRPYRVDFVLLEHFSMASSPWPWTCWSPPTCCAPTASFTPLSLDGDRVLSDLGLELVATELSAERCRSSTCW